MRVALALILMLMAGAALAVDQRLYVPGVVPPIGGTGRDQLLIPDQGTVVPPPACSNSLDFSDGCNSQYIGAL